MAMCEGRGRGGATENDSTLSRRASYDTCRELYLDDPRTWWVLGIISSRVLVRCNVVVFLRSIAIMYL